MKSKTKKIYASVVVLAAVAFVADRWVVGHAPATAEASTELAVASPTGVEVAAVQKAEAQRTLAARLREAADAEQLNLADVRDAYRPCAAWVAVQPAVSAPAVTSNAAAVEFRQHHRLDAVMTNARGGFAIIDGKTVRPGQKLDGFKLLRVGERTAVLSANGSIVEMNLDPATLDPASSDKATPAAARPI